MYLNQLKEKHKLSDEAMHDIDIMLTTFATRVACVTVLTGGYSTSSRENNSIVFHLEKEVADEAKEYIAVAPKDPNQLDLFENTEDGTKA